MHGTPGYAQIAMPGKIAPTERIIERYGPALEALADWSRSGCPCAECWLKREIRRIVNEVGP